MKERRTAALVAVGIAAGLLATVLFGGNGGTPVQAQAAAAGAAGAAGRYQLSAYGYGLGDGKPESLSEHGAYILDTQTGEVFVVRHHDAPKPLGSVAKR